MKLKIILSLAFGFLIALPAYSQTKQLGTLKTYKDSLTFKKVPNKTAPAIGTVTIRTDTITVFTSPDGKVKSGLVTWGTDSIPPPEPIDTTTFTIDDAITGTGKNQNNYNGSGWSTITNHSQHYASTLHSSKTKDNYVTFIFTGKRIQLIAPKFNNQGKAAISIDGGAEVIVDQYDRTGISWSSNPTAAIAYDKTFTTVAQHTIKVRVTGEKNSASTDTFVFTDGWIVHGSDSEPPPIPSAKGEYFVGGPNASDSNDGTASAPFATCQKCATIARPGEVCKIRAGTYRETITPANSGTTGKGNEITFRPDGNAVVVISGLELVGDDGWAVHTGNIYKKSITLPVNGFNKAPAGAYGNGNAANMEIPNSYILANQIIKNGSMIIEAGWPKGVKKQDNYFDMVANNNMEQSQWVHASQGNGDLSPAGVTDNHLTIFPPGSLVNGYELSQGWYVANSARITSNNGNRINTVVDNNRYAGPGAFWRFYRLTGLLQFLTQENEFYYGNGSLYVWQPGGGSPKGLEYKARNSGFNLKGRQYISIIGLTFIGCDPVTGNTGTSNIIIDNIRAKFLNHNLTHSAFLDQGHGMSQFLGTKLWGSGNVVKNSEFAWSANVAVWLGANCTAQNNLFHHIGYDGMWGAPVMFFGFDNVNNIKVLNNTMYTLGRGGIDNGFASGPNMGQPDGLTKNTKDNEIAYNNIYDFSKRCQDGGAFYSCFYQNTSGLRIHHNWIHDQLSFGQPNGTLNDGILAAIYFDMGSGANAGEKPTLVDHNVIWGMDIGRKDSEVTDILMLPYCPPCSYHPAKQAYQIYNNTIAGRSPTKQTNYGTRGIFDMQSNIIEDYKNNILDGQFNFNGVNKPGYFTFGVFAPPHSGVEVKFQGGDIKRPEAFFQVQQSSPAAASGTTTSVNGEDTSPKEIGAYYYGQPAWVPGYVAVTPTEQPAPPNIGLIVIVIGLLIVIIILIIIWFIKKRK